jgi:hypothetical protein
MSYLLQVALMQALTLAAYQLLLRHEPLGQFKRIYLLIGLLLPFAIPYWTIYYVELPPAVYRTVTDIASPLTPTATPSPEPHYLPLIYWTGFTLLALRFCYALYGVTRQLRRGRREEVAKGARWMAVPGLPAVHSFGPWVFYPAGSPPSSAIVAHELAHVRQLHTLDRLLVALLRVVWWFNPILYLYERAIM